ncbi:ABC transporter related protein [Desulfarculus baarsii DSM 2075]|uniref:ABC transporter related protein n=1 Tax=Desulfarculus baarsii (strain ATCC 33931 / DSM 2075 / LMG 7858 / VKM B-1802 / 2st14) TaxID=644282 RepID=E1QFV9_DESB2|nr:ATP-binding cassette domain-containing protein [Desulfarculus baarsii]ADK84569.1 ABC transporter related protein [Desulfarculus baarsii DSM 2075]
MIELRGVSKRLGRKLVIRRADLVVRPGQIVCLSGPSGVGKTTLLEIMAGLTKPDAGLARRQGAVALAFQDDALLPWLDAAGNMDYALAALPPDQRRERRRFWLERFELPPTLRPEAMSGGMRRRLNLARALASQRPILLLDEPFAFLDLPWQAKVAAELAAAAHVGAAVALVSHQLEPLDGLPCRTIAVSASPVDIVADA